MFAEVKQRLSNLRKLHQLSNTVVVASCFEAVLLPVVLLMDGVIEEEEYPQNHQQLAG